MAETLVTPVTQYCRQRLHKCGPQGSQRVAVSQDFPRIAYTCQLGLVSSFTPVRIESTTASALWMQATISRKNPDTVICSSLLLLPFRCHEERGAGFTTRCTEFETWCGRLTIAGLWDRVPNRSSIYACASAKPFMSQYEDIHYSWPLVRSCCQMRCGQSHWCVRPS